MTEERNNLLQLPKGWVWTKLKEIAEINPKLPIGGIPDELELSFLPMKAVEELTGKFDSSITRRYSEVKRGFTSFVDGDIIFAKITPCMENGKMAIVNNLKSGMGFGSTEFHVVRLIDLSFPKGYVFYYLLQEEFRGAAKTKMKGTAGQLRVSARFMEEAPIPLAPLAEQRRIVGKVDELFSCLDAGVESLLKAKTLLKRYHQAVLKYAFKGKLTEEWRKTHKDQVEPAQKLLEHIKQGKESKKLLPLGARDLPELPDGWAYGKLEDLIYIAGRIGWRGLKAEEYTKRRSIVSLCI